MLGHNFWYTIKYKKNLFIKTNSKLLIFLHQYFNAKIVCDFGYIDILSITFGKKNLSKEIYFIEIHGLPKKIRYLIKIHVEILLNRDMGVPNKGSIIIYKQH